MRWSASLYPGHSSDSADRPDRPTAWPSEKPPTAGSLWPHPQSRWRPQAHRETDTTLRTDLESLIEPVTRGDPESPLRWTSKSVRKLADELQRLGHQTSHRMVAALLHELGYSLQANRKTLEGSAHPDRDAQFAHIHQTGQGLSSR